MAKPKIMISILTDQLTSESDFGLRFLESLFEMKKLSPEFVGNSEPIARPTRDAQQALPAWAGNPFLWKRKHAIISRGSVHHTGAFGSGAINIGASADYSEDWLSIFQKIVELTKAHYGYAHLFTDDERSHTRLDQTSFQQFWLGAFSKTTEQGFFDLGWANYFGQRWDKFVDKALLKNFGLPCARDVSDGFLFSITNNISDVETSYLAFSARREEIKSVLAYELFNH